MGLGTVLGGGLIKEIFDKVGGVASELITDKDKRAQLQADLARLQLEMADKVDQRIHEQMIAQTDINKIEAGSSNFFVAGWRPAVGWIGAVGAAYTFVIMPMASWIATVMFKYSGNFPQLDNESLWALLAGLLGFGGLRSFEKYKGVGAENPVTPPGNVESTTITGNEMIAKSIVPPGFGETIPEDVPWKR